MYTKCMIVELQTHDPKRTIPAIVPDGFSTAGRRYWLSRMKDGSLRAVCNGGSLHRQVLEFLGLTDRVPANGDWLDLSPGNLIEPAKQQQPGKRFITWDYVSQRYRLQRKINDIVHRFGYFRTIEEAERELPKWLRSLKKLKPYKPLRSDDERDDRVVVGSFADRYTPDQLLEADFDDD
jgi:hypothetical protein